MDIKRCLKIRLYPTPDQFQMITKTGGCRRFVYNKYVEAREQFYANNIKGRNLTKDEKSKIYKGFKYTTEKGLCEQFPFLKKVSSVALQQARRDAQKKRTLISSLVIKENHISKRKKMVVHFAKSCCLRILFLNTKCGLKYQRLVKSRFVIIISRHGLIQKELSGKT